MKPVECFNAVAAADAVVLILGSMPGVVSLRQMQYYAHPENQFWNIMGELFAAGRELSYAQRLLRLQASKVALWDVAARCQRPGSLDSKIRSDSVVTNDFQTLFTQCSQIHSVCFNGRKAAELFRRLVLPKLSASGHSSIQYLTLPSTSPAYAAMTPKEKIHRWQRNLLPLF